MFAAAAQISIMLGCYGGSGIFSSTRNPWVVWVAYFEDGI
jgi:hypothetical protein